MAVIKKTKTISKSKSIKGSSSRKQFNKSKKGGSQTRKMKGGSKIKPSPSGPGKMKSKKNLWGRAQSWVQLHAPGGKAKQIKMNEQAKLIQIEHMASQREKYYSQKKLNPNSLHKDPNIKENYFYPTLKTEPLYSDPASLKKKENQKIIQAIINRQKTESTA